MKNIISFSLFIFSASFIFAQSDTASVKKIEIGINTGYAIPLGGSDLKTYYKGSINYNLSVAYKLTSSYSLGLNVGYSKFKLKDIASYVTYRGDRMLVVAPPYTELIGGSIQAITIDVPFKILCGQSKKVKGYFMLAPTFSFMEKRPVDGTDSSDTYQILEHYVHEKPFGICIGGGTEYALTENVSIEGAIRYRMNFTKAVLDHSMMTVGIQLGFNLKF